VILRVTERLKRLLSWAGDNNVSDKEHVSIQVGDLRELVFSDGEPIAGGLGEGSRVLVDAAAVEFRVGGNTLWVHGPEGSTVVRIKCEGTISIERCQHSPWSHMDLVLPGDMHFCLGQDAEVE